MKPTDSSMSINCRCGAKINSDTKMRLHKKVCAHATEHSYKSLISDLKLTADFKSPVDFMKRHDEALKSSSTYINFSKRVLVTE
jgi:hypothetical protein